MRALDAKYIRHVLQHAEKMRQAPYELTRSANYLVAWVNNALPLEALLPVVQLKAAPEARSNVRTRPRA
jgi:hypothetical protein